MRTVIDDPARLVDAVDLAGSPVNILWPHLLADRAAELTQAAARHDVAARVFFARKANKALCFVAAARDAGLGVDVASDAELEQVVQAGVAGRDIILTAAVKPAPVRERAVRHGVTIAVDNADEVAAVAASAREAGAVARVAPRLAPDVPGRPATRFGMAPHEIVAVLGSAGAAVDVVGVHFHLDGYAAADRVAALDEALHLVDALRAQGHPPAFIDIGGGIPMRYLDDDAQWDGFWSAHRRALADGSDATTYRAHPLGLHVHDTTVTGTPNVYPMAQQPVRGAWLDEVLGGRRADGATIARAMRERGLALHMEPGRALLDGGGITVARVEFRKRTRDGTHLVGLAMNRTQMRSAADDFLLDPLHVATGGAPGPPCDGFLVGAYCIERELITWRRLAFTAGVAVGDLMVFPNTAGYMMHILESASHQMPLAANLVAQEGGFVPDPIDEPGSVARVTTSSIAPGVEK